MFVNLPFKLHVSAHFGNVFGLHAAPLVGDAQDESTVAGHTLHLHRAAQGGELEGVFEQLINNFGEVILGNGRRSLAQLQDKIVRSSRPPGAHLSHALDRLPQVQRLPLAQRL